MGEIIRSSGVPKWAWSIILTAFLALMSFTIGATAGNQKMKDNIDVNTNNIIKHNVELKAAIATKADKELMQRNYETLIRIEHKLDEHIKDD